MEQEIYYKVTHEDLKREFTDLIRLAEKERRNQTIVDVKTVAGTRNVAAGNIPALERMSDHSPLKFRLGDILEILDNGYKKDNSKTLAEKLII